MNLHTATTSPASASVPDQRPAGEAPRRASWRLPHEPASVPRARRLAVAQLAKWALARHTDDTELLVGELVTNAVRHARGPLRVTLLVRASDGALRCEVEDAEPTAPPRTRSAAADDEGGRGLHLVEMLSRRWGSDSTDTGKAVWFELQAATAK